MLTIHPMAKCGDLLDRDGPGKDMCPLLPQLQKCLQPKCPPVPRMVLVPFAEIAGTQSCSATVTAGRVRVHLFPVYVVLDVRALYSYVLVVELDSCSSSSSS